MKKLSILLIAVAAAACEDRVVGPERSDLDAIQTAFFAQLMAEEPFPAGAAYCVSVGTWAERQNPSDDVVNDLQSLFGKVRRASECVSEPASTTYNGDPARSYHVESVLQEGIVATASGLYRQSDAVGAYYTAHLEKQGSLWVIDDFIQTAVF
jgi:hypothetical protein